MFLIAVVLIWAPFLVKKVISGNTHLHNKSVWMTGAIFVYFFSVSGSMHNIIRKMPMFLVDRNDPGKLVFFYQGSGMQLGAEGFAVGFLYTLVGLLLAFVTHVLVYVRNRNAQRYIHYCRTYCHPRLSESAASVLQENYVKIRQDMRRQANETGEAAAIPITMRQLEAVVRLNEALARMRLLFRSKVIRNKQTGQSE